MDFKNLNFTLPAVPSIPQLTNKQKKIIFGCVLSCAFAGMVGLAFSAVDNPADAAVETSIANVSNTDYASEGTGSFISAEEEETEADYSGSFIGGDTIDIPESEPLVFTPTKKAEEDIEEYSSDASALYGEYSSASSSYSSSDGWRETDGKIYFYRNGTPVTGWLHLKNGERRYCYFDTDGHMLMDEETPDGYYVGKDGIYILPQDESTEFKWDKSRDLPESVSGLMIGGKPAEFYMLCIAGENSGYVGNSKGVGDRGRGYGIIAFDYRAALVPFMKYAYQKNPTLWKGFASYISYKAGDQRLVNNTAIRDTFLNAMDSDFKDAVTDQLEFGTNAYFVDTENALRAAGIDLDARPAAVSGALFSVTINCGAHPTLFSKSLSNSMTDEQMIRKIYELRNTVLAKEKVGSVLKGTTTRYMSAEPAMALDLLYGQITIDSDETYGGGVEWHGNPFSNAVTTSAVLSGTHLGSIHYENPVKPTALAAENSAPHETNAQQETTPSAPIADTGSSAVAGESSGEGFGPGFTSGGNLGTDTAQDRAAMIAAASGETQ